MQITLFGHFQFFFNVLFSFQVTLSVDVKKLTLKQFDEDVLKKSLNVIEPEVTISGSNTIILTSEDEYEDEYLGRTLFVRSFTRISFYFAYVSVVFCQMQIFANLACVLVLENSKVDCFHRGIDRIDYSGLIFAIPRIV